MIERVADGSWRFAVHVWHDDGADAMLVETGALLRFADAPGGRSGTHGLRLQGKGLLPRMCVKFDEELPRQADTSFSSSKARDSN